jgi:hypothetical protein
MRSTLALPLLLSGLAAAQVDKDSGRYTVTLNGKDYSGDRIKLKDLPCQGTVKVRGVNNGFDIDCGNLNLYDYVFTGAKIAGRKNPNHPPRGPRRSG